ncbi:MAG TPA: molybdopterin-binding protein [Thermoguttaceae bacterium]|nr:molybdopterin-binding protein [Thermoguttaceae bacterium]
MQAEVISLGDELTSGRSLDTNAQWLSRRLEELGIWVVCHTTVGDQMQATIEAFCAAIDRADVVVCTGGLGPTADDLTREAMAATVGRPLICDPAVVEHIRCLFARRGWKMPEQNKVQAMYPEGGRLVPNPYGTAPGLAIDVPRAGRPAARVYCLPGVPAEMREMWNQTLAEELRQLGGGRMILTRRVKCFGAGESSIEGMLPGLTERGRQPRVGITASQATITLSVTADGATAGECRAAMEPTLAVIRQRLGHLVFGEDDDELQDAAVRLLRRRGWTLATAEWATEGFIAQWLAAAATGGLEILGGVVMTHGTKGPNPLELPFELLTDPPRDGVSLAEAAAQAVCRKFGTDCGLAVGPFPRVTPSSDGPEPVVFALVTPNGSRAVSVPLASHPELRKVFCAKKALDFLRLELMHGGELVEDSKS